MRPFRHALQPRLFFTPCSLLPSPLRGIAFLARLALGIQQGDELVFLAKQTSKAVFPKPPPGHPFFLGIQQGDEMVFLAKETAKAVFPKPPAGHPHRKCTRNPRAIASHGAHTLTAALPLWKL